ncbi:MAG: HU family DNA-binding protein [Chlorobiaceae bacterium]
MPNHDLIDQLASQLQMDEAEAGRMLSAYGGAMAAELLDAGRLSVRGLGSFRVVHSPSAKKSTSGGVVLTPPSNRLVHDFRLSGRDGAAALAVSRLSMKRDDAAGFARWLAGAAGDAVKNRRGIHLNGFGRFSVEQGSYRFTPEPSLEELLNCDYRGLQDVVIPGAGRVRGSRSGRLLPYALPALLLFVVAVSVAFYRSGGPGGKDALEALSFQASRLIGHSPVSQEHPRPAFAATSPRPAVPDSLLLEHGEYTIVLATFRQQATAERELIPLRTAGIVAYIWPASLDGLKYFRLMTGKFSSRSAAALRLKELPGKAAGDGYVQQVYKRVVLHGE